MPGYLLTMNAAVTCLHNGTAKFAAPNPRVKVAGQAVPMIAPPVLISGCQWKQPIPPAPPPVPCPCLLATWLPVTGTVRVKSMGQPLLCQSSQAQPPGTITTPPAPPVPLLIRSAGQTRVKGM